MADGIGLAEKMLGLAGLVVLEVDDVPGELVVHVESHAGKGGVPVVSATSPGAGPHRGPSARSALLRACLPAS